MTLGNLAQLTMSLSDSDLHYFDAQQDEEALSAGVMAQGLAWVRSQRERRRREYLQNQAELQRRKLQEAAVQDEAVPVVAPPPEEPSPHATVSQSGDGFSFNLDLPTVDSDDYIPTVRIAPESVDDEHPPLLDANLRQQVARLVLLKGVTVAGQAVDAVPLRVGDCFGEDESGDLLS